MGAGLTCACTERCDSPEVWTDSQMQCRKYVQDQCILRSRKSQEVEVDSENKYKLHNTRVGQAGAGLPYTHTAVSRSQRGRELDCGLAFAGVALCTCNTSADPYVKFDLRHLAMHYSSLGEIPFEVLSLCLLLF